ncbi:MAG TPA: acetyl-CoA decarbonylase/synthase complex subunit delta [Methanoregulaceae archaeon]|nr:acetyl-CoA decarbonylase/synthase complex subunit delta [Methanoregulaceae archaeon]HRY75100.1 acetyl-CoA decarbonylase/synthase complex subunit delta [Methanoregulaceae archaeon]
MELTPSFDWTGSVGTVTLGATAADGGTRSIAYRIGGGTTLPLLPGGNPYHAPLVAFEICDDPRIWPSIALKACGDITQDIAAWARTAETAYRADIVRLYLTSTRQRNFSDIASLKKTVEAVLAATKLPVIIEGSNEPAIDSEVFLACGEAGQGERLLLGTAEAGRYRSIAAAALAYNHAVIAQSPIDINLAKQLNILMREIGVPRDHIVIDPYTGALGYGFEYSFSAMERIRFAALKGDTDLAMPMICSAIDSLNIKEVRDAGPAQQDAMAVRWETYAGISAVAAGAEIICVRHPESVVLMKEAIANLTLPKGGA